MKTTAFLITSLITNAAAFAPSPQILRTQQSSLQSSKKSFDPLNLADNNVEKMNVDVLPKMATVSAAAFAMHPLAALAEEVDDYEYGAVKAPIGIAVGAGVLAILTALLPVVLQGGEEAFEEMKDRDSDSWGTGSTNALNSRKRR